MPTSPENPQFNIRPGLDIVDRLAVWALAEKTISADIAKRVLKEAIDKAFEDNPALEEAHQAIVKARDSMPKQS